MSKKILLLIASTDFQPLEYSGTKEELEKAGFEVVTASDKKGMAVSKEDLMQAKVDVSVDDININDYDGFYIIGGPGALDYLDNEIVYNLLRQWQKTGKPFGAICISTRILAHAGVLKGKKAAGWNGDGELPGVLEENGAEYSKEDVFQDNNIITASGPMAAHNFGQEIAKTFK